MMQEFCHKLKNVITKGTVLTEEPMSRHTSFQIGGPAEIFVQPATGDEVRQAICLAKEEQIPFFVVGNGSNLLVSDDGFRGTIVQIGRNLQEISVEDNVIYAQAGALLSRVARTALEHGLTGMEFAAGIPGSLGGAVAMNAGAYGGEMKDILTDAEVLTPDGEIKILSLEELDLSYRHSCIFDEDYIVLSVHLQLEQGDTTVIRNRMDELARARREKQPLEYPSAGSTFKRPEGYFAGALIQDAGLKGYTVGGAQVSEKHSGFVINRGGATAEEVLFLIKQVQKKVKSRFGVTMEPEVRMVGFTDTEVKL
ncbi:MAG: UDP-N-acetylmuramate dehydrogenase [Anaerobutyricum sp.]|nr:UDP-N-acetylmuramate dehydrogenase [Anaerobutyricum sp.]